MKREDLKGITARTCPAACTPERCIISTVAVCKHPMMVGDGGCGPITMANREIARKVIKIGQIEGVSDAEPKPGPARLRSDVVDGGGAKKAPKRRKKAHATRRGKGVPARGQGPEDRPAGEARPEKDVAA